jgi:hypothetical protein
MKPWSNKHVSWLVNTGKTISAACGAKVEIWELRHTKDKAILSAWAKHFRNHYCFDSDVDALRDGTGHSRADYLKKLKFPDKTIAPGPSIRSGDLAEVLVADYVEYILKFWVPRTRYAEKAVRNESTKGSDILGFKILDPKKHSKEDVLAMFESKAQLSTVPRTSRLQDAVNDSAKDHIRKAESLNAAKQRLLNLGDTEGVSRVARFQNLADRPYKELYGAAVVLSTAAYCQKTEMKADTSAHPFRKHLSLLLIHGKDLMKLVHDLYERAANEA